MLGICLNMEMMSVGCSNDCAVIPQVSDWWEEYVYLRGRNPIMVNSNYYVMVPNCQQFFDDKILMNVMFGFVMN